MTIRSTVLTKNSGGPHFSSAPGHSGFLQRKCACGGAAGASGECEQCQKKRAGSLQRQTLDGVGSGAGFNCTFSGVNAASSRSIAINRPDDGFEQEADRTADAVVSDRRASVLQSAPASFLQRDDAQTGPPPAKKEPSNEDKYQAALKKFGEAFLETSAGKELKGKAVELGKDFVSSVEGKVIAGTALGGALAALIAANKELPVPIPEIPLDFIAPGLKAKLVWEGPVRNPTTASLTLTTKGGVSVGASYSKTEGSPGKPADERAGLTITIPLGGSPAKPKSDADKNEKYRAETARLEADQDKFREGMKPAAQKAAENKEYWEMFWRMKAGEKKKDDLMLMREATQDSAGAGTAPPVVHDVLSRSGQPLDGGTREFMESRFGRDFSGVRIHTDAKAAESARAVNARGYTVGSEIVFASGEYRPSTAAGRRLLAHELTHVVQQGGQTPENDWLPVRPAAENPEREAAANAARAHELGSLPATHAGVTGVQRDLATAPPPDARAQDELTPDQIHTALAFNRTRFTAEQTRLIQDIIGTEPTGNWTEGDIQAVAQIQEEYHLKKDGQIGAETFRFLDREQGLEGASRSDAECLTSFFVLGFPAAFQDLGGGQHQLRGHFQARAQFPARCDCADFEYRQFIHGHLNLRRGGVTHDLSGIFTQLPAGQLTADFREDGDTSDNPVNYGHRDQPADADPEDHYLNDSGATDQARGCRYRNEDFPGATLNTQAGDEYDALIAFRGEIQRKGRAVRTLNWTPVSGTFRVP